MTAHTSSARPAPAGVKPRQSLLASLLILLTLVWSVPATAQPPSPAPLTDQAHNNRPYLLIFPVIVLGIIGVLVVTTRNKRKK